ncbi:hypothetical protein LOK49_LG12G00401 [Camellia lanceoleosa]|uniref:Uncharacterized protein n=1 Tax=Camellia lanceoleosa TaxID=1840588 RepID=A0ACC0FS54_9ERIC|nr:hypothetical protein LOK49_LG12G00401 [Camellia lanceoleosa]
MKSFLLGLLCSSPNNFPTEIIQNISIEVVRDIAESAVPGLQILASNSVIKVVISSNEEVAEDEVYLEKSVSYQTPQQREWSSSVCRSNGRPMAPPAVDIGSGTIRNKEECDPISINIASL